MNIKREVFPPSYDINSLEILAKWNLDPESDLVSGATPDLDPESDPASGASSDLDPESDSASGATPDLDPESDFASSTTPNLDSESDPISGEILGLLFDFVGCQQNEDIKIVRMK